MATYIIQHNDEVYEIEAKYLEEAAKAFAKQTYGRAGAERITGMSGMSGYFQTYRTVPRHIDSGHAMTSVGKAFHVREA